MIVTAPAADVHAIFATHSRAIAKTRPNRLTPKDETIGIPWSECARPKQLPPPGDWRFWLIQAGRGFGKTRTGAEYIRTEVFAGRAAEIMLIAATTTDVRDIVIEGPSGIVKVCERAGWRVRYEPSKMRVVFPNGAIARTRGADEPDRIRGPECDLAWWDEFGTWKHRDAFTNADFGLRKLGPKGDRARAVVTFTPKPKPLVRELVSRPDAVVVRGSTDENSANLDPATLAAYRTTYEGTRLGRQELGGELLEDVEGALWNLALIDLHRIREIPKGVTLVRVVVAVDPSGASTGAECGIVVAARGSDKRGYVLADYSKRGTPNEWANAVVAAYDTWEADAVIVEKNFGGDMATNTIQTIRPRIPIKAVHASRGKAVRAEPISSQYVQGHWSHVGSFPALEDQMCTWTVDDDESPDRMDALVWSGFDLMLKAPVPVSKPQSLPKPSEWARPALVPARRFGR